MASASVTFKVSPYELQIIREALRLYKHVNGQWDEGGARIEGFQHNLELIDAQPQNAVLMANKLLNDIGLK